MKVFEIIRRITDGAIRVVKYTIAEENNTDLICLQCGGKCGEECVVESGAGACAPHEKT